MNAGRFRDSLESTRVAERLADELGDDRLKAYALFGQAWTYGVAGAGEEAIRYAERAEEIWQIVDEGLSEDARP